VGLPVCVGDAGALSRGTDTPRRLRPAPDGQAECPRWCSPPAGVAALSTTRRECPPSTAGAVGGEQSGAGPHVRLAGAPRPGPAPRAGPAGRRPPESTARRGPALGVLAPAAGAVRGARSRRAQMPGRRGAAPVEATRRPRAPAGGPGSPGLGPCSGERGGARRPCAGTGRLYHR
jgi:hypothetical protein